MVAAGREDQFSCGVLFQVPFGCGVCELNWIIAHEDRGGKFGSLDGQLGNEVLVPIPDW